MGSNNQLEPLLGPFGYQPRNSTRTLRAPFLRIPAATRGERDLAGRMLPKRGALRCLRSHVFQIHTSFCVYLLWHSSDGPPEHGNTNGNGNKPECSAFSKLPHKPARCLPAINVRSCCTMCICLVSSNVHAAWGGCLAACLSP